MIVHGRLLRDASEAPMLGWLAIEGDRIAELGEGEPRTRPSLGDADSIICPGFIDAHLHLPQFDSIGCDGLPLLEWLERVIFPAEMRWSDPAFAAAQVRSAYQRLLRAGTLGYAGFLTSHFHGYEQTVRAGYGPPERGAPLRAIVGQVLMDRNAPTELLDQPMTRLARSKRARVECSVNPRFAVACSDALLAEAGRRAAETGAFIQTHLAESLDECERVRQLFPDDPHYAAVYDRHGLLTQRTLLGHCVHLSPTEWELIAARRSVVVHCPTANTFLQAGAFDLAAAREHDVRLALGSDVAAGPDVAMPRVARAMIEVAKLRAMLTGRPMPIPSPAEAWQLITRGNAEALGWNDAGHLEVGAAADLLVLRPSPPVEIDQHLIGRLIHAWDHAWIESRIVNGKVVDASPQARRARAGGHPDTLG